jgi:hypothetical protein
VKAESVKTDLDEVDTDEDLKELTENNKKVEEPVKENNLNN